MNGVTREDALRDRAAPAPSPRDCLELLASRGHPLHERYADWRADLEDRDPGALPPCDPVHAAGCPLYIAGAPEVASLEAALAANPTQSDGHEPLICIVETDLTRIFRLIESRGAHEVLRNPRLRTFLGERALDDLAVHFDAIKRYGIEGPVTAPRPGDQLHQRVSSLVSDAISTQRRDLDRILRANAALYSGRDASFWAARFADGSPHRILLPTTRYSTYVRHAASDIAESLEALGHEVTLVLEPDAHTRFTSLTYALAVQEHEPDLVLVINYTRANLAPSFPDDLPMICWIQDALQHLYNPAIGAAQGPLDFVAGLAPTTLFRDFGYDRNQALFLPVLASRRKFLADTPNGAAHAALSCEIACVTHHSRTPAQLRDDLIADAGSNPVFRSVVDELLIEIERILSMIERMPFVESMHKAIAAALSRRGLATDDAQVAALLNQVCTPLADRMIRQQTLEWAASIARRRNWTLRIFGAGWDDHPTLAPFAQGPIEHGDALRDCYRSASAHLHASINWNLHQRVMECALAGGLPLCRRKWSDLELLACDARARVVDDRLRRDDQPIDRPIQAAEHAASLTLQSQLQALGPAQARKHASIERADGWLSLTPEFCRDPWAHVGGAPIDREIAWLLGDLTQTTFASELELETILERAVERPEWRGSLTRGISGRVQRHLTYEHAAEALLQFVSQRLESLASAPLAIPA